MRNYLFLCEVMYAACLCLLLVCPRRRAVDLALCSSPYCLVLVALLLGAIVMCLSDVPERPCLWLFRRHGSLDEWCAALGRSTSE